MILLVRVIYPQRFSDIQTLHMRIGWNRLCIVGHQRITITIDKVFIELIFVTFVIFFETLTVLYLFNTLSINFLLISTTFSFPANASLLNDVNIASIIFCRIGTINTGIGIALIFICGTNLTVRDAIALIITECLPWFFEIAYSLLFIIFIILLIAAEKGTVLLAVSIARLCDN